MAEDKIIDDPIKDGSNDYRLVSDDLKPVDGESGGGISEQPTDKELNPEPVKDTTVVDTDTDTDTDIKSETTEEVKVTPIVWAYNPYYLDIDLKDASKTSVDVQVGQYKVKVALHGGKARAYISRLLQLCFTTPATKRVMGIGITVKDGDNVVISEKPTVVWGGINIGERVFNSGVYEYDGEKGWLVNHVPCFVNFPFTLELLLSAGTRVYYRTASTRYNGLTWADANYLYTLTKEKIASLVLGDSFDKSFGDTFHQSQLANAKVSTLVIRQDVAEGMLTKGGTFDGTYDYTFHSPQDTSVITHLHFRKETEGFYLRWVNHFGFICYYLFDGGEQETKATSDILMPSEITMGSQSFGFSKRSAGVKAECSIKMCAVNLDRNTFAYVRDIVSSPIIDLYMGKDKDGNEIWTPVSIADGSFTTKTQHNYLTDMELEVTMPNKITQTL